MWLADNEADTVTRVDPTGLVSQIPVGQSPSGLAVGADGVWVARPPAMTPVVRIDLGKHESR